MGLIAPSYLTAGNRPGLECPENLEAKETIKDAAIEAASLVRRPPY